MVHFLPVVSEHGLYTLASRFGYLLGHMVRINFTHVYPRQHSEVIRLFVRGLLDELERDPIIATIRYLEADYPLPPEVALDLEQGMIEDIEEVD